MRGGGGAWWVVLAHGLIWKTLVLQKGIVPSGFLLLRYCHDCAENDARHYSLTNSVGHTLKTIWSTPKSRIGLYSVKNLSIYSLTLHRWRPSWNLPTTQCLKYVLVTSGISENPTVDTKIMNLFHFCREIIAINCLALRK